MKLTNNKGITIVSLIITIIIMLILIGVSVNVAINSDFVDKAEETEQDINDKTKQEQNMINSIIQDYHELPGVGIKGNTVIY